MQTNSTVDFINKSLKISYGTNIYNESNFRVVFSDDQTEKRYGTFNEFSGKVFVRTVQGIKEVQKYPWINRKWILERWASGELAYHPDLDTEKKGVYICIYVFQDVNSNYLPPLLKVCEIVINNVIKLKKSHEIINRDKEIDEIQEKFEIDKIQEELVIASDEAARKDPKASRDSMSSGYTKILIDSNKGE